MGNLDKLSDSPLADFAARVGLVQRKLVIYTRFAIAFSCYVFTYPEKPL